MFKKFCIILMFFCLSASVMAQNTTEITLEPIVVTATRIEIPLTHVGKATTLISEQEIEQPNVTTLAEALQAVPGLLVSQQGGPGGMVSLKIRGLDTEYTQILINGLPVRNPSDTQGSAVEFMDDILIEHIERIEIVRGASSTLYGSDSVGGTINIITKKGTEIPELFALFEGGSLSTYCETAGVRGKAGAVNYALTGKRVDSDGIGDHDEYSATALAGQIGVEFSPQTSLNIQLKYTDTELDLNESPEIAGGIIVKDEDDPDDSKEKTLLSGGVVLTGQFSENLDYTLKLGYVDVESQLTFGPEGNEFGFGSEVEYSGNILNGETQVNYRLNEMHLITMGYEYETEEFEQDLGDRKDTPDAAQQAVYLQDSLSFMDEHFTLTPGVRYMDHDQAGDRVDWEISTSYLVGESGVRFHGHVGTGFRAPSLYELYGASVFSGQIYQFGNEDLDPEESLGWDIGLEMKALEGKARFDITYFMNDFDQIIGFGTVGYENIDGGESKGIEVEASYALTDNFSLRGAYTYTKTEDANGDKFYGVPEHQIGVNANYRMMDRLNAHVGLIVRSKEDIPLFDSTTFLSERYENDGYMTVNLAMDYQLSDSWKIWGRVENLFDEEYTVSGYEAPGRGFYGGIRLDL